MKYLIKYSLAIALLYLGTAQAYAQSSGLVAPKNIFEALEGEKPGEGTIVIEQPEALRRLVGGASVKFGRVLGREGNTSLLMGYRIQFYNGNLPTSKKEVEQRATSLRMLAPEFGVYVTYNAPFWRLVLGDFTSMEAARTARTKLLKTLPTWGKESYVVRDKVRIINYNPNSDEY